jgi:hypothetical protein
VLVELSPQLIVALKSLRVPVLEVSLNDAVDPVNAGVMNGGIVHVELSDASATFALESTVALLLGVSMSVITTVTWYEPSSA